MDLFGVDEFARRTGRSMISIYRDVENGRIGHIRIGRHIRFSEPLYLEFLKQKEVLPVGARAAAIERG